MYSRRTKFQTVKNGKHRVREKRTFMVIVTIGSQIIV